MKVQIVAFVDATSGADTNAGANNNRYYVNAFTSIVTDTTGSFLTNTNRRVSRRIENDIQYRAGGTSIAAGIQDLREKFLDLPRGAAGLAVVITDGRSTRSAAAAAANALRSAGVTVAAVAIGDGVDRGTLEAVASTGSDGEELVFGTDRFDDIAGLLAEVFTRIGAPQQRDQLSFYADVWQFPKLAATCGYVQREAALPSMAISSCIRILCNNCIFYRAAATAVQMASTAVTIARPCPS